jgi:hypothetical protein
MSFSVYLKAKFNKRFVPLQNRWLLQCDVSFFSGDFRLFEREIHEPSGASQKAKTSISQLNILSDTMSFVPLEVAVCKLESLEIRWSFSRYNDDLQTSEKVQFSCQTALVE